MKSGVAHGTLEKREERARVGLFALFSLFSVVSLVVLTGCSLDARQVSSETSELSVISGEREITIAHSSWAESVAVATLTEVVLEEDLDYEVELRSATPEEAFEGLSDGEVDVFQGIWRPQQDSLVSAHENDVDMLGAWLFGTTRASLAAPAYMEGVREVSDLENFDGSSATEALVLSPGASGTVEIPDEFFERHGLEKTVYPDSAAMMEEVERRYDAEEPFVFLAYSPHWMNLRYELNYLEGGDSLVELNTPSTLHAAAKEDLASESPEVRALLAELSLTEYQIESLELSIEDAGNPEKGARAWINSNEFLVASWVYAAREAS